MLEEYIAGGYFIVRSLQEDKKKHFKTHSTPIVSVSDCIADVAPQVWATDWSGPPDEKERKKISETFGIPSQRFSELVKWYSSSLAGRFPNSFPDLATARRFLTFTTQPTLQLIGIGLHAGFLTEFMQNLEKDSPNHGSGLKEVVALGETLETGGKVLGFEPLGYEGMAFHSWLCQGNLVDETLENCGVRLNQYGFLPDLVSARSAAEFISRPEVGADPVLWNSWLLVEYPSQ